MHVKENGDSDEITTEIDPTDVNVNNPNQKRLQATVAKDSPTDVSATDVRSSPEANRDSTTEIACSEQQSGKQDIRTKKQHKRQIISSSSSSDSNNEVVSDDKKFECTECEKAFENEDERCNHYKEAHRRELQEMILQKQSTELGFMNTADSDTDFESSVGNQVDLKRYPNALSARRRLTFDQTPSSSGEKKKNEDESGNGEIRCKICDKRFSCPRSLPRHMKSLHKDSAQCDTSVKKATASGHKSPAPMTLSAAGLSNREEKTVHCQFCESSFYTNAGLEVHSRVHNKGKSFPCDMCEESFFFEAGLDMHMKNEHGKKNGKVKPEPRFWCEGCNKPYIVEFYFKAHRKKCTAINRAIPGNEPKF